MERQTCLFDQIQYILVIDKLYVAPIDFFFRVFFLFHLKDMLQIQSPYRKISIAQKKNRAYYTELFQKSANLIEMLLQFFIGKVDTELLKATEPNFKSAVTGNSKSSINLKDTLPIELETFKPIYIKHSNQGF